MGESQNDHAEWKKSNKRRIHTEWFHWYEILENGH